jgi:hypothetical protein
MSYCGKLSAERAERAVTAQEKPSNLKSLLDKPVPHFPAVAVVKLQ